MHTVRISQAYSTEGEGGGLLFIHSTAARRLIHPALSLLPSLPFPLTRSPSLCIYRCALNRRSAQSRVFCHNVFHVSLFPPCQQPSLDSNNSPFHIRLYFLSHSLSVNVFIMYRGPTSYYIDKNIE